jgi:hypothetical protein
MEIIASLSKSILRQGRPHSTAMWAILTAVAIVLAAPHARAGMFSPPDIPDGEKLTYRAVLQTTEEKKESFVSPREEVTKVTQIITRFTKNGRPYYRFFRAEQLAGGQINYYTYVFTDFEPFRFVVFEKRMQSTNGRVVKKEITYFDDPAYTSPPDLNHFFSIPMTLRGIQFQPGVTNDLLVWFSSHLTPWKMNVIVEGKESVTVPAGTFECWKVRVEPDLKAIFKDWYWIARIVKPWVPDFYYWFAAEAPYPLIKYQGTFGPEGVTPPQVQELIEKGMASQEDLEMVKKFSSAPEELVLYEDFMQGRNE